MGWNVVVLLKPILDPELPARKFRVAADGRRPERGDAPVVINPFDQNALELALQLKDKGAAATVTAISAGGAEATDGLRKALALKADRAVRVELDGLDLPDAATTARVLAAAVRKVGHVDLVLAGRQAGDWDQGQVGYLLAEELGWPCAALVQQMEPAGDGLRLVREAPAGREVLEARPPLVVTVTNDDSNVLRLPKVRDVMMANRKPIDQWTVADLGLDAAALADEAASEVLALRIPERKTECEMIEGDDPAAVAATLVRRLRELKVL
ncbi:electron transfer flavoprotein subunit beta/FixA family protein [Thermaerobacter composti]|uniref:Electron transfer flavoprotein subunit beta/FixA family protein n=1 Tax=Thermaerobacter composti TaxID=554949 RepID=A0ABZ0QQG2_9FIRM|nr:electron transfer flavoprotein subunit beta/FixA family protein [Thermaerobacter composti]WPD19504.1 electron transfer flavoprotein subunit beta/FixA family protein [Thermaerobacter composti]